VGFGVRKIKTRDNLYEDWGSELYESNFEKHPLLVLILKEVKKSPVLDVGCGNGNILEALKERGFEVKGIDPSKIAVSFAKGRGVDVTLSNINNFNPRKKFGTIIMIGVIDILLDYKRDFTKANKWLEKDGEFILTVVNRSPLLKIFRRIFFREIRSPVPLNSLSDKEFLEMIKQNNLVIKKKLSVGRFLRFFPPLSLSSVYILVKSERNCD